MKNRITNDPRECVVINQRVQWRIAWQTVATWIIGICAALIFPILAVYICGVWFGGLAFDEISKNLLQAYTFPLFMTVAFTPLAIWHSLQFSHRIAGPMHRFQRTLQQLTDGETIDPVQLRPMDFWHSFGNDLNQLARKMGQLNEASTSQTPSRPEPSKPNAKSEFVEV